MLCHILLDIVLFWLKRFKTKMMTPGSVTESTLYIGQKSILKSVGFCWLSAGGGYLILLTFLPSKIGIHYVLYGILCFDWFWIYWYCTYREKQSISPCGSYISVIELYMHTCEHIHYFARSGLVLFYGVYRHFQQYFSYILALSFIGRGNQSTWRKPSACRKSLTNVNI